MNKNPIAPPPPISLRTQTVTLKESGDQVVINTKDFDEELHKQLTKTQKEKLEDEEDEDEDEDEDEGKEGDANPPSLKKTAKKKTAKK